MENLEKKVKLLDKIKRAAVISFAYSGLALCTLSYGCPPEPPSEYCCEAKKCGEDNNPPICDGSGDDCYCRAETCCEQKDCGEGYYCVEGDTGGCICETAYDPSDRYDSTSTSDDFLRQAL